MVSSDNSSELNTQNTKNEVEEEELFVTEKRLEAKGK